jgi:hypothetical protein
MICDRCQEPILKGQGYRTYPIDSASGAGTTVVMHKQTCQPVPSQTAPSGRGR